MAKTEKSAAELYREERKKRLAKAAKKNSQKSISSQSAKIAGRIVTIIIVVAIAAAVCGVVVNQSGIIERSKTAFTIGDDTISQAEYGFYYMSNFNQYYQYAQYGYVSLDTTKPLSEQTYGGEMGKIEGFPEDQTPTWADFVEYQTKQQMTYIKGCGVLAEKAGIELSDDDYDAIEANIKSIEESANSSTEENARRYSASAYLKANYGKGMNLKLYRAILADQQLATAYQNSKIDEYSDALTNKEINEEYKNNITNYGRISLLSFNIPAGTETDSEGNEAATEKTLAAAKTEAEKIAEAGSEAEFRRLCKEVKKDDKNAAESTVNDASEQTYSDLQSLSSDSGFLSWASDTKTQADETYVYNDGTSGSTVFFMVDPIHKAADSVVYDSRHILIKFPEAEAEETAEEAESDPNEAVDSEDAETTTTEPEKEEITVEPLDLSKYGELDFKVDNKVDADSAKNKEAFKKIQDILEEYLDGEHTEEAFAALADKYTEDTGSAGNGGLYEDTPVGNFVAPYEEWCLADGRKAGDVGIVEYVNEENYSGYHLIYFIAQEDTSWKDEVKESLASEKYNGETETIVKEAAQVENVNDKVIASVAEFLDKILKRNANSSAQSY